MLVKVLMLAQKHWRAICFVLALFWMLHTYGIRCCVRLRVKCYETTFGRQHWAPIAFVHCFAHRPLPNPPQAFDQTAVKIYRGNSTARTSTNATMSPKFMVKPAEVLAEVPCQDNSKPKRAGNDSILPNIAKTQMIFVVAKTAPPGAARMPPRSVALTHTAT